MRAAAKRQRNGKGPEKKPEKMMELERIKYENECFRTEIVLF